MARKKIKNNEITKEQKSAIECFWKGNKNMLLSAGAGSGKTFTIIQSLIYASNIGIDFSNIHLITFTRKAAEEIRERLKKNNLFPAYSGTIHSLGYKIYQNLFPEKKKIILENVNSVKNKILKKLFSEYSYLPEDLIYNNLTKEEKEIFLQYYFHYKEKNNLVDFDDMIHFFYKYPDKLPSSFSNKIIIIDEFQDTSYHQVEMIKWLHPQKVFAVGDAKQSIYRFRGADLDNFFNFSKEFYPSCVKKLRYNFRSQKKILHFANYFISKTISRDKIKLKSSLKKRSIKPKIFHLKETSIHKNLDKTLILYSGLKSQITFLTRTNYIKNLFERKISNLNNFQIMTVHASKGLEFPYVVILGVSPEYFPHPNGDLDEEERIFYVAATRAMDRLDIIAWSNERGISSSFLPIITRVCKNIYL